MASTWKVYDSFVPKIGSVGTDAFKCALFTSAHTPARGDDSYSAITGEVAAVSGYATGGASLAGVTITEAGGVWTFDCNNITAVTAAGGDVTCRYAIIYNNTDAGKQLVALCQLDTVDVVVPNGYPLVLITTDGIFTTSTTGW